MKTQGKKQTYCLCAYDMPQILNGRITHNATVGMEKTIAYEVEQQIDAYCPGQRYNITQRHCSPVIEPKHEDSGEITDHKIYKQHTPVRERATGEIPMTYFLKDIHNLLFATYLTLRLNLKKEHSTSKCKINNSFCKSALLVPRNFFFYGNMLSFLEYLGTA